MEKLTDFLKRIRLVYRPASRKTKKILLYGILLSVTALVVLNLTIAGVQNYTEKKREEAAAQEQKNNELKENIDGLGSADSVEQIAKDELGLVDPDTTVVVPGK